MRGIIVAVSPEGVIGKSGQIPWRYPGDLKRFKELTLGTTVIMGRRTWESIGRPLPQRTNRVVTSRPLALPPEVSSHPSIESALQDSQGDVWFIGGSEIYREALRYADILDVTYVPDHIDPEGAALFPGIDPAEWAAGPSLPHEYEPALTRRVFRRIG